MRSLPTHGSFNSDFPRKEPVGGLSSADMDLGVLLESPKLASVLGSSGVMHVRFPPER